MATTVKGGKIDDPLRSGKSKRKKKGKKKAPSKFARTFSILSVVGGFVFLGAYIYCVVRGNMISSLKQEVTMTNSSLVVVMPDKSGATLYMWLAVLFLGIALGLFASLILGRDGIFVGLVTIFLSSIVTMFVGTFLSLGSGVYEPANKFLHTKVGTTMSVGDLPSIEDGVKFSTVNSAGETVTVTISNSDKEFKMVVSYPEAR